jgi:anti-sigma factor ChrR (cupin superfamily)
MTQGHSVEEARERAALYASGALTPEESAELEAHIAGGCSVCRDEERAMQAVWASIAHAARPQRPRPQVRQQLLERIAAAPPVEEKEGLRFVRPAGLAWQALPVSGVEIKPLHADPARGTVTALVRMAPGASYSDHRHTGVEETMVIEGELQVSGVCMGAGSYCRAEVGSIHRDISTRDGCVFIVVSTAPDNLLHDQAE